MSAIIGIGFVTTYKEFFETGKDLGITTNKVGFRKRVVEELKSRYNIDSLYVFYSKVSNLVGIFEKIFDIARPFSIINHKEVDYSKGFKSIKDLIDPKAIISICVFVANGFDINELPERYHTVTYSESKKFKD